MNKFHIYVMENGLFIMDEYDLMNGKSLTF